MSSFRFRFALAAFAATAFFAIHSSPFVLGNAFAQNEAVQDEASLEIPEGFTSLFDGTDLDGWHAIETKDPREMLALDDEERNLVIESARLAMPEFWRVENGEIVNDGNGPFLTTDNAYRDFELVLEYKTVAGADSGIYLKATPQVQIWDTTKEGGKEAHGALPGSGGLWNNSADNPGKDPLVHADKPFGEWNHVRVRQIGARTSVWLNGQLVVDNAIMENYWDRSLPLVVDGPIQLQTHGGEIRWRNIGVREIPGDEANSLLAEAGADEFEQIFNGTDFTGWAGPVDKYEVNDGILKCKPGSGGTIYFDREYSDFVARFEFKLPPGGNNGLAIRYPGGDVNTAYEGMCELQVLDTEHEKYKDLKPRQVHGSVYGMIGAHRGYHRPTGEWNYQQVTVHGSRIVVELNGSIILNGDVSEVTEFMDDRLHPGKDRTSGYFGFAGHNDPVEFRNIFVKPITE